MNYFAKIKNMENGTLMKIDLPNCNSYDAATQSIKVKMKKYKGWKVMSIEKWKK